MMKKLTIICLSIAFSVANLYAQSTNEEDMSNKKDLLGLIFGEKKKEEKKIEISPLPYVASSPSTGLKFGAVANLHYRLGDDLETKKSSGTVSLAYTTHSQLFFYLRDLTYFPRNEWAANVDIRYNNNNEKTYGLGSNSPNASDKAFFNSLPKDDDGEVKDYEQIDYSTIRSNISLMKRVTKALYLGGGINYNNYFNIEGYQDTLADPYYNYNTSHSIDPTRSVAAGVNLAGSFDTRDNINNAYRGIYALATYSFLFDILGSDEKWQHLWTEFRAFQSLTENHRHRLAFWANGSFITGGTAPYMNLPATGYDLFGKSSYGYTIGRLRGDKLLFGQLEYRVGITNNDLIGAVAFANATTVSSPDGSVKLFEYVKPAAGIGLRIKLNKFSRTNISVDYAIGADGNKGFYLDINETF